MTSLPHYLRFDPEISTIIASDLFRSTLLLLRQILSFQRLTLYTGLQTLKCTIREDYQPRGLKSNTQKVQVGHYPIFSEIGALPSQKPNIGELNTNHKLSMRIAICNESRYISITLNACILAPLRYIHTSKLNFPPSGALVAFMRFKKLIPIVKASILHLATTNFMDVSHLASHIHSERTLISAQPPREFIMSNELESCKHFIKGLFSLPPIHLSVANKHPR
jgi:hypothetical protein